MRRCSSTTWQNSLRPCERKQSTECPLVAGARAGMWPMRPSLTSREAKYVSGTDIVVDGGLLEGSLGEDTSACRVKGRATHGDHLIAGREVLLMDAFARTSSDLRCNGWRSRRRCCGPPCRSKGVRS